MNTESLSHKATEMEDPEIFFDIFTSETDANVIIKISHISNQFKPVIIEYNANLERFSDRDKWIKADEILYNNFPNLNDCDNKLVTMIALAFYIDFMLGSHEFQDLNYSFESLRIKGKRVQVSDTIVFSKTMLQSIWNIFHEEVIETIGELRDFLNRMIEQGVSETDQIGSVFKNVDDTVIDGFSITEDPFTAQAR